MENIAFISHKENQCGVYQFGAEIAEALQKSQRYSFHFLECDSEEELAKSIARLDPAAIIYNYHPTTLSWVTKEVTAKFNRPQIGMIHEITQEVADAADNSVFDFHIGPDPTLISFNPIVFKTGRLIPNYSGNILRPEETTIGSFGFATGGKGFEHLVIAVQNEFDKATIKLHIPQGTFADNQAQEIIDRCQSLIVKDGIKLIGSHNFLSKTELLDFLAGNTLNAFFYDEGRGRGISSVIEKALAVKRPIAITRSNMFRHILNGNAFLDNSPICVDPVGGRSASYRKVARVLLRTKMHLIGGKARIHKILLSRLFKSSVSLKKIIANDIKPLETFNSEWVEGNIILDYERIVDKVLGKLEVFDGSTLSNVLNKNNEAGFVRNVVSFNRILDNEARTQYKLAIDKLLELSPEVSARKIPEANIQQAFVLDTVQKVITLFDEPKILCAGSYEDTAAISLKQLGHEIDEVDPAVNTDLSTFFHHKAQKESYDIVFSTSVLEHVPNDELFITQIVKLLAPGGIAIITFDFNDQFKPGAKKPFEDCRLYTQRDIKERIIPLLKNCLLIDEPNWDCPNPDFTYGECQYTFATLVFQKKAA